MKSADWDMYRVLVAVADRRSFSAGALALGISQPTAGRRIDQLETLLGTRLLVRQSRGVVPTAAGEVVLTEARRMADGALAIERSLGTAPKEGRRTVRVSMTEGFAVQWLPERLAKLESALAHVKLELIIDAFATDLSTRQADIAIRLFKPTQTNLVTRRVGSIGFGLFASPAYLEKHGRPRRLSDLAKHRHVGFVTADARIPAHLRWYRAQVPEEQFVVSASTLFGMVALARAGIGITVATAAFVKGETHLQRVLRNAPIPSLDVWLTTHSDVRRDPSVASVVAVLAELFDHERANLAGD